MTGRLVPREPATTAALRIYEQLGRFPGPWLTRLVLERRVRAGKEVPERLGERFGVANRARPDGELIWLHAASVGETTSLLPLMEKLLEDRPDMTVLLTTGTRTSAELAANQSPKGVIHQFVPIDLPSAVESFLDHWRPSLLGVVESEIWPCMLATARRRGVSTALLSARLSEKSAAGWARAPRSIAALLDRFDSLLAQNEMVAERLRALGADAARIEVPGSLKDAAAPLPVDLGALEAVSGALAARPRWIAASTHAGEEAAALVAHRALAQRVPGLLTIIAPRHPERGDAVCADAEAAGFKIARRSETPLPGPDTEIFVVDCLGELGLWYRAAPIVLVGGSLGLGGTVIGGHNPMEPARLGGAILFGQDMANFSEERRRLLEGDAAIELQAVDALADTLAPLFGLDGGLSEAAVRLSANAADVTASGGAAVLMRYVAVLSRLLDHGGAAPARATV